MWFLLLGGLALGAFALSGKKTNDSGGTTPEKCAIVKITKAEANANVGKMIEWAKYWNDPSASVQSALIDLMQRMRPDVSWTKDSCVKFTNPDGITFDWQTLMSKLEGVTIGEVAENPGAYGLPYGGPGQGSSASNRGPLARAILGA